MYSAAGLSMVVSKSKYKIHYNFMGNTLIFSVFVRECFKLPLSSHWLFNVFKK